MGGKNRDKPRIQGTQVCGVCTKEITVDDIFNDEMLVIPLNRQECSLLSLFINTLLEVLTRVVRNKSHNNWKGRNKMVVIYRRYYCLMENPKELRKRIIFFKIESLALLSYAINTQISIAFSENSIKFCCHQFQLRNDPQVQGPRHTLILLSLHTQSKFPAGGSLLVFKGKFLKRIFTVKRHQEDRQCKCDPVANTLSQSIFP